MAALYSEQDKSDASQATRRVATAATGFDTGRGFHARPGRLAQNVCLRCMFADLKTSCRRIGKDCILFDVQAVARISVRFIVRHR